MNIEDSLLMLDVLFDVRVRLAADGEHIEVRGTPEAVEFATANLLRLKPKIVAHLSSNTSPGKTR